MVDELFRRRARRPFHNGFSHLTADDVDELHRFAKKIGLRREWFQDMRVPHYDLTPSRRARALAAGAVFVPAKEQARARLKARGT